MKRVSISIQSKKHPEKAFQGYALTHEISAKQISFFTTQKIPIDEELILSFYFNGQNQVHPVIMKQLHEQISSGRIMNAVPDETNPFPARKFYRCYAWLEAAVAGTNASTDATPATGDPVPDNVTPITAASDTAATTEGTASVPAADSSAVFGAEDAAKAAADAAVMDAINNAGSNTNAA